MKGWLKDLTIDLNGRQNITVAVATDFREQFMALADGEVEVQIKKYRPKRSLESNAYAWVLIDKLAEALHMAKLEVYREAIRDIGGVSETVCVKDAAAEKLRKGWETHGIGWQTETMPSKIPGCTNVVLYYGSSTYDSKQMSALIDRLVEECKAQGIETATPEELAMMAENWNGRKMD